MPDPLASELMHVLGQDHGAKWLFAQIVPVCRAQRRRQGQPRLITREKVEELCRAHHVDPGAVDALVAAVDGRGDHLFLEPWPGEPGTFRLPELWCEGSSAERVKRHRLKMVDEGHPTGQELADRALRDLAAVPGSNFVTVAKFEDDDEEEAVEAPGGALTLFPAGAAPATRWVRGEPPAEVVKRIYDLWWAAFLAENPKARYRNLTSSRQRCIVGALKRIAEGRGQEGRDDAVRTCEDGVRGWVHDTFGDRSRFADLKWVMREGNVETFADWHNGVNMPRALVSVPRATAGSEAVASATRKRDLVAAVRQQRAGDGGRA